MLTFFISGSLKVAEADLLTARAHVQQFQEISQASETAFLTLTTTYDDYKSTSEAQILQYQVIWLINSCFLYSH